MKKLVWGKNPLECTPDLGRDVLTKENSRIEPKISNFILCDNSFEVFGYEMSIETRWIV